MVKGTTSTLSDGTTWTRVWQVKYVVHAIVQVYTRSLCELCQAYKHLSVLDIISTKKVVDCRGESFAP